MGIRKQLKNEASLAERAESYNSPNTTSNRDSKAVLSHSPRKSQEVTPCKESSGHLPVSGTGVNRNSNNGNEVRSAQRSEFNDSNSPRNAIDISGSSKGSTSNGSQHGKVVPSASILMASGNHAAMLGIASGYQSMQRDSGANSLNRNSFNNQINSNVYDGATQRKSSFNDSTDQNGESGVVDATQQNVNNLGDNQTSKVMSQPSDETNNNKLEPNILGTSNESRMVSPTSNPFSTSGSSNQNYYRSPNQQHPMPLVIEYNPAAELYLILKKLNLQIETGVERSGGKDHEPHFRGEISLHPGGVTIDGFGGSKAAGRKAATVEFVHRLNNFEFRSCVASLTNIDDAEAQLRKFAHDRQECTRFQAALKTALTFRATVQSAANGATALVAQPNGCTQSPPTGSSQNPSSSFEMRLQNRHGQTTNHSYTHGNQRQMSDMAVDRFKPVASSNKGSDHDRMPAVTFDIPSKTTQGSSTNELRDTAMVNGSDGYRNEHWSASRHSSPRRGYPAKLRYTPRPPSTNGNATSTGDARPSILRGNNQNNGFSSKHGDSAVDAMDSSPRQNERHQRYSSESDWKANSSIQRRVQTHRRGAEQGTDAHTYRDSRYEQSTPSSPTKEKPVHRAAQGDSRNLTPIYANSNTNRLGVTSNPRSISRDPRINRRVSFEKRDRDAELKKTDTNSNTTTVDPGNKLELRPAIPKSVAMSSHLSRTCTQPTATETANESHRGPNAANASKSVGATRPPHSSDNTPVSTPPRGMKRRSPSPVSPSEANPSGDSTHARRSPASAPRSHPSSPRNAGTDEIRAQTVGFDADLVPVPPRKRAKTMASEFPVPLKMHIYASASDEAAKRAIVELSHSTLYVEIQVTLYCRGSRPLGKYTNLSDQVTAETVYIEGEVGTRIAFDVGAATSTIMVQCVEHVAKRYPCSLSPKLVVLSNDKAFDALKGVDFVNVVNSEPNESAGRSERHRTESSSDGGKGRRRNNENLFGMASRLIETAREEWAGFKELMSNKGDVD